MTTPQYKKLLEITNYQPIIHPGHVFIVEHDGAVSPDISNPYATAMQITCTEKKDYNEVMQFVERYSGKSGWIIRDGFPLHRKDGRWSWVLVR